MAARLKDCRHLCAGQQCPDRHPPAQRLGQGQHVRLYAVALESKHLSGTPHAALDLVEHQQHAVLLPDLRQGLHKLRGGGVDPTLSLHRLH